MERNVWLRSGECGQGTCVEVMHTIDDQILVRDSKNPTTVLQFTVIEWDAFVAGAKDGEFDNM